MTDTLRTQFRSVPIEQETEPFRVALRSLPSRLRFGPGGQPSSRVPVLFAAGFGLLGLVILGSKLGAGLSGPEIFAFCFIAVVALGLAAPWLWRRLKGVSRWTRSVELHRDRIDVTDSDASGQQRWSRPMSEYRLCHEHTRKGGIGATPAPQFAVYDMLILRHADRSRDIPLRITAATGTGGMTLHDMIDAGRQGDKARVEAAMNDRDNPEFEAFKGYVATLLDMEVVDARPD